MATWVVLAQDSAYANSMRLANPIPKSPLQFKGLTNGITDFAEYMVNAWGYLNLCETKRLESFSCFRRNHQAQDCFMICNLHSLRLFIDGEMRVKTSVTLLSASLRTTCCEVPRARVEGARKLRASPELEHRSLLGEHVIVC